MGGDGCYAKTPHPPIPLQVGLRTGSASQRKATVGIARTARMADDESLMTLSNGEARQSIPASELAALLFSRYVLADEATVMRHELDRYKDHPAFKQEVFRRKVFVFLVASVAVALTKRSDKGDANMAPVINRFRELVSMEMHSRWGAMQQDVDESIEMAATSLASLLFTNPESNRGLSFDWAQEWLKGTGVDESNPVTLFKISHTWKVYWIDHAEFISKQRVA